MFNDIFILSQCHIHMDVAELLSPLWTMFKDNLQLTPDSFHWCSYLGLLAASFYCPDPANPSCTFL